MKISELMKKATMTEREKVIEALKANPICSPMNKDLRETELDNDGKGKKVRMWLNPNNQTCFNFGWFEYQDFYDWIEGKGKIVKGKTPEEKQKFWEVAKFVHEHHYGWSFIYYKKYFHLIDETYRPAYKNSYVTDMKKPLKITKTNHAEIIAKVMGDCCRWYGDTTVEPEEGSRHTSRMRNELDGMKKALFLLGVGYYGAVNLPEEPENLSWIADICVYKAAYLYCIKNNVSLPDFDFVSNYKEEYGK